MIMRITYCCNNMRNAVKSGFITFSPTTTSNEQPDASMFCGGWGFMYCPFCGERMESERD